MRERASTRSLHALALAGVLCIVYVGAASGAPGGGAGNGDVELVILNARGVLNAISPPGGGHVGSVATPKGMRCAGRCARTFRVGTTVTIRLEATGTKRPPAFLVGLLSPGWSTIPRCDVKQTCSFTITKPTELRTGFCFVNLTLPQCRVQIDCLNGTVENRSACDKLPAGGTLDRPLPKVKITPGACPPDNTSPLGKAPAGGRYLLFVVDQRGCGLSFRGEYEARCADGSSVFWDSDRLGENDGTVDLPCGRRRGTFRLVITKAGYDSGGGIGGRCSTSTRFPFEASVPGAYTIRYRCDG